MKQPRSGGPRTEAGKAKCAQNAVKHGATSTKVFVLTNENPEAWNKLLAAAISDYAPTTEIEHRYVEAIAFSLWRLRRIWAVQTCAINLEMDAQAAQFAATYAEADENVRRTLAVQALTAEEQDLERFARYEAAIQRAHDRAVRNLKNLREMRAAQPEQLEITKQTPEAVEPEPLPQLQTPASEAFDPRTPYVQPVLSELPTANLHNTDEKISPIASNITPISPTTTKKGSETDNYDDREDNYQDSDEIKQQCPAA